MVSPGTIHITFVNEGLKVFLLFFCLNFLTPESVGMQQSVQFALQYLLQHGPFDGLMGFSQGAAMVTRLAMLIAEQYRAATPSLRFLMLIGGVQPTETRFSYLKVAMWLRCLMLLSCNVSRVNDGVRSCLIG